MHPTKPPTSAQDSAAGAVLCQCRPVWEGIGTVGQAIGSDALLLHAGPPFRDATRVPPPVQNSLALACVYEGWADSIQHGHTLIASGAVPLAAAQDHGVVVPLAGVASPSMATHVVRDANHRGRIRHAVLNEGPRPALRLGLADPRLPSHHAWLNDEFAVWLADTLGAPIDLLPILHQALGEGDDCHSRTQAGSRILTEVLGTRSNGTVPTRGASFLAEVSSFALNLWMAASAVLMAALEDEAVPTAVVAAGGNGDEFGIRLAAGPRGWTTVPATPPHGPIEPEHAGFLPVGALGDSAVVDMVGFGGQALMNAPTVHAALGEHAPADMARRARLLATTEHPGLPGKGLGMTASSVVASGLAPIVLLGMIEQTGNRGRIGGGVYEPPIELFRQDRNTASEATSRHPVS